MWCMNIYTYEHIANMYHTSVWNVASDFVSMYNNMLQLWDCVYVRKEDNVIIIGYLPIIQG